MVPHATGKVFVPSNEKGKAKVPCKWKSHDSKLLINSHLIHVEADFGNGLVTGLSIYHQAIGKDLAHLDALRKRKKKETKTSVPHQPLQALPETPRSIWPIFYWNAILNLWPTWPWPLISIISDPPQVLFTYSQPTKHFMPMMSLSKPSPYSHRTFNYILDVFKFKESLLHSFHLCSLSLHVVLSACTSLVAHQRKSILSILLWLPILTLPVSGTAVRQLSPFPCWWQGFVFFPATWESWF